ncbi:MAG TPA: HAMP domain-containing sensor histidine kinase [Steroidobacteraceae bacterium]|jgi:signal transduction histidine kinase|nr:HAMP domain-containing sensor histidine kinase [Steroidobacteraceae bacterium]
MLRLYLRFYIALLASLALLGLAASVLVHFAGGPMEQVGVTVGRLVQNVLPPAPAPASEQQEALRKLAAGLSADVTLFAADGTVIAAIGHPLPMPRAGQYHPLSFGHWRGSTFSSVRLADGRLLVASVPIGFAASRFNFHLLVIFAALAIGVAMYPVVRQLTGRLERLQRGVDSLGAGDLGARVAVEGRDEIAGLAESFNRAAGRIEQLIQANRSLLANASHELRTPLARIRLAVEMLKLSADPKSKAGLEQDIAELDGLVDEILLASRLDTVAQNDVREEIDLLALAAEECARYDEVQLEGAQPKIHGDPRLLRRLLRNLLENAKRHGVPPTQVRLRQEGDLVVLKVWDDGPGPAAAEFEQLFTPFYRRRDSQNSTGNGLGLSLVRQIARRHGGDARCASMDDGRSCFIVTLRS